MRSLREPSSDATPGKTAQPSAAAAPAASAETAARSCARVGAAATQDDEPEHGGRQRAARVGEVDAGAERGCGGGRRDAQRRRARAVAGEPRAQHEPDGGQRALAVPVGDRLLEPAAGAARAIEVDEAGQQPPREPVADHHASSPRPARAPRRAHARGAEDADRQQQRAEVEHEPLHALDRRAARAAPTSPTARSRRSAARAPPPRDAARARRGSGAGPVAASASTSTQATIAAISRGWVWKPPEKNASTVGPASRQAAPTAATRGSHASAPAVRRQLEVPGLRGAVALDAAARRSSVRRWPAARAGKFVAKRRTPTLAGPPTALSSRPPGGTVSWSAATPPRRGVKRTQPPLMPHLAAGRGLDRGSAARRARRPRARTATS